MTLGAAKFTFMLIIALGVFFARKMAVSKRDWAFLALAFVATLGADFFLLVVPNYILGVVIFCFAHIFYALRFGGMRILKLLPLALILPTISIFALNDALLTAAIMYMSFFIISYSAMIYAVKKKKYGFPNNILIFAGMTLFVLCDIFVAIFNLGGMGHVPHNVSEFAVDAIWLFYAPSQICLMLSGINFEQNRVPIGNGTL